MKHNNFPFGKRVSLFCGALAVSGMLTLPTQGLATVVVLNNGNSTASVDLDNVAGMYNWSVDGQNQLNQQWFWYRIGSGVPQPINAIGAASPVLTGTDRVTATYTAVGWDLEVTYHLTGGSSGSGTADIEESIMFCNESGGPLDFHLYQYSDFNLLGTAGGDQVYIDGNTIDGYNYAVQWKGPTQIAEAINLPPGQHAEANTTPNTLNSLGTTLDLVLNDNTYAAGDVTWALQWDALGVADGEDFQIFKDKLLSIDPIPEPSSMALIGLGIAAWGLARRRQ